MNMWDFLAQCGFWQWVGLIVIVAVVGEKVKGVVCDWRKKP